MTTILHLARRSLNGQPNFIAELQRRGGHNAKTCVTNPRENGARPYPTDIKANDKRTLESFARTTDVLHLHEDMTLNDELVKRLAFLLPKHAVIVQQYHHEVMRVPSRLRRKTKDKREFVIHTAKKGALIDRAKDTLPVVVPLWRPELQPVYRNRLTPLLVWTPTTQEKMLSYQGTKGKGYRETLPVLRRLEKEGIIDLEIIENLNWRETMEKTREANIRLDEVVTGSYGMSTLEGLAQGCITISGMNDACMNLLTRGGEFPGMRSGLKTLERAIRAVATMTPTSRLEQQKVGAQWMNKYHSEQWMRMQFDAFYNRCLSQHAGEAPPEQEPVTEKPPAKISAAPVAPVLVQEPQDMADPMTKPLRIVQIAKTHCAGAIWRIHDSINRYTHHSCRTVTLSDQTNGRKFRTDVLLNQSAEVRRLLSEADVVHFHNWIDHRDPLVRPYIGLIGKKACVLQYHTEPRLLQNAYRSVDVINRNDIKTLAIAQKHLRFYPKSTPVPNMVDINDPMMIPDMNFRDWQGGPLKVIYTPSDKKKYPNYTNTCCGKGYEEMMPILQRLEKEGIIELTVITEMTWEQLMPIKKAHDVCIDEVMTGGYHLCSLEALSQGLITIGWIDQMTQHAIERIVGRKTVLPWQNTGIQGLEGTLRNLQRMKPEDIKALKNAGRKWMEDHWNPARLVEHFIRAYEVQPESHLVSAFARYRMHPIYNVPPRITDSLGNLRNAWGGRKVFIWGNGPSANEAAGKPIWDDASIHIGTNAATRIPNGIDYDAYCISDLRFLEDPQKLEVAKTAPGVRVYLSHLRTVLRDDKTTNFVKTIGADGICSDLMKGAYHGRSVVWIGIQLALWAGANDIVLVGCEHNYQNGNLRFYREQNGKTAPVDHTNTPHILRNYQSLMRLLPRHNVSISTYGTSRLQQSGVPRIAL